VSPDGISIAYCVEKGDYDWCVAVDHKPGKSYSFTQKPCFSPDGRRLAYIAKPGDRYVVVLDEAEQAHSFDGIYDLAFSPDSRHLAYLGERDKKFMVVCDSREGEPYDGVVGKSLGFSASGSHFFYLIKNQESEDGGGEEMAVVVDNEEGPRFDNVPGKPVFSPNEHWRAYLGDAGEHVYLAVNDNTGNDNIGLGFRWIGNHRPIPGFLFNDDDTLSWVVLEKEGGDIVCSRNREKFISPK